MSVPEQRQVAAEVQVRPFSADDYQAVVDISNATFPDAPATVEEWRYDDEHFDKSKYVWERYVACEVSSGHIVGYAGLRHIPWNFHPQKFELRIRVHPNHRRLGVGTRLWGQLLESLRQHHAIAARTMVREDMADAVRFATRRGFDEVMRAWESRLDVRSCDLVRFREHVERAMTSGMTITTLAAERARDPSGVERLYALHTLIGEDIPAPDQFTPPDFRLWVGYAVESPYALLDAHFIAVAGGEYVGVSNLFKPQLGDWLTQGTTGVRREYRGRGIATALKVRTVEYAKARGIREIRTFNEIRNAGILVINERFGFVRQPAWVHYEKRL